MKPYVTMEEVISTQGADSRTHRFLTAENGCTNGCASGTTIYASNEFSDKPGVHNDQEGFYAVSYTHLRAHETLSYSVFRLMLE